MEAAKLKSLLDAALSWPEEDQEELLEAARHIEARRKNAHALTSDERAAILEGLEQAKLSRFAPDAETDDL